MAPANLLERCCSVGSRTAPPRIGTRWRAQSREDPLLPAEKQFVLSLPDRTEPPRSIFLSGTLVELGPRRFQRARRVGMLSKALQGLSSRSTFRYLRLTRHYADECPGCRRLPKSFTFPVVWHDLRFPFQTSDNCKP